MARAVGTRAARVDGGRASGDRDGDRRLGRVPARRRELPAVRRRATRAALAAAVRRLAADAAAARAAASRAAWRPRPSFTEAAWLEARGARSTNRLQCARDDPSARRDPVRRPRHAAAGEDGRPPQAAGRDRRQADRLARDPALRRSRARATSCSPAATGAISWPPSPTARRGRRACACGASTRASRPRRAAASRGCATTSATARSWPPTRTASPTSTWTRSPPATHGHGGAATVTVVRPELQFGVAVMGEGDTVIGFQEKPRAEHWINGGFFCFEQEVFDYLSGDSSVLEREPLEGLAGDGALHAYRHTGFWACMDTYKDADAPERPVGRRRGAVEAVGVAVVVPTYRRPAAPALAAQRAAPSRRGTSRCSSPTTPRTPRPRRLLDEHPLRPRAVAVGRRSRPGREAQRRPGARPTAELIVFTDDDCRPPPGWLAALVGGGAAPPRRRSSRARRVPTPTSSTSSTTRPHARSQQIDPVAPDGPDLQHRLPARGARGARAASTSRSPTPWGRTPTSSCARRRTGTPVVAAPEALTYHAVDWGLRGRLRGAWRWGGLRAAGPQPPRAAARAAARRLGVEGRARALAARRRRAARAPAVAGAALGARHVRACTARSPRALARSATRAARALRDRRRARRVALLRGSVRHRIAAAVRVALCHPTYWPEVRRGAERLAHDAAVALAARGHAVRIVTSHRAATTRTTEDGVEVLRLWRPPGGRLERRRFEPHVQTRAAHLRGAAQPARPTTSSLGLQAADAAAAARAGRPSAYWYMGIPHRAWLTARRGRAGARPARARAAAPCSRSSEHAARRLRHVARGRGAGRPAARRHGPLHARRARAARRRRSSARRTRASRASAWGCWSRRCRGSAASTPAARLLLDARTAGAFAGPRASSSST